jgi:hypothetical protein
MAGSAAVRLSTVVMAHPRRREAALWIQRAVPELDVRIVFDPEPAGPPATLRTARAAWAAVAEGATHHLVLQDDVLLPPEFPRLVRAALLAAPAGAAVSLFAGWSGPTAQAVRLAALAGASWTTVVDDWTPTQALVLPAGYAREFAEHAGQVPATEPDNRVMHAFLARRGVDAYVSVPSLVEHGRSASLLMNDLLHGIREATVYVGDRDPGAVSFTGGVVRPPAVSHIWLGSGDFVSSYSPVATRTGSMTTPTHEVLRQFGMSDVDISGAFARDRERHPASAELPLVGECFQFSLWLTMFMSGVIAGSMFPEPDPRLLRDALEQPWAGAALATFPAAALRKMASRESLMGMAARLAPFCRTALHSGLAGLTRWPRLTAVWEPHRHDIRPHWARAQA